MPSPFPGMNPYLEQASVWRDFHHSFIVATREVLAAQISPAYFVRIEGDQYFHEIEEESVWYMEVLSKDDRRVVTIIELLSWTNKYS